MPNQISVAILEHDHEEIKEVRPIWERVEVLVEEEEEHYADPEFFLTLPNEDANQKKDRRTAFLMGFYNPSQDLVSVMGQYILRRGVTRLTDNQDIKALFEKADLSGQSLNDFVKNMASPLLKAYGTVFAVVDKPRGNFANKAAERESGMPYLSVLHPEQVKDFEWDATGKLLWFRYTQSGSTKRENPFPKIEDEKTEYITWTQTDYFRHDEKGTELETFAHGFGMVPVAIQASFIIDPGKTIGKATFFSSSRYLIMGNNLRSIADIEVMKYGSLLLANVNDVDQSVRTQPLNPDTGLPMMSVKRDEAKSIIPVQDMTQRPEYLTKDIQVVDKARERSDLYFQWAFETEATGKDAKTATTPTDGQGAPQSGIAKAYDFADMDAALYDHAMDLQAFEVQVVNIWKSILKITDPVSVSYPTSFDVRSFSDKIQQIKDMKATAFPSKTAMATAFKKVVSDITQDKKTQTEIEAEIDAEAVSPQAMAMEAAKPKPPQNV